MSESYIPSLFAERIGGSQYGKSQAIYKFEKIKRAKRAAMAAHPGAEIIDLGVGEPRERRTLLLPRDEHPDPGRASRDRDGVRRRPRGGDDPDRARRAEVAPRE